MANLLATKVIPQVSGPIDRRCIIPIVIGAHGSQFLRSQREP